MADWSQTWTFFEGEWHEGNVPLWGVRTHAIWLGSSVFDGARVFEGVAPDLDLHCTRVNASAKSMHLKPLVSTDEWMGFARDGIRKFAANTAVYVRPMYWAERAGPLSLPGDPESTRFALSLYDVPMKQPTGFSITLSPYRRPAPETAPLDAKAGCLYPNNARAMLEAKSRGFDNCVVCDLVGNVAELANSNLFIVKTASCARRSPTARSFPASRAGASSACCAAPASRCARTCCAMPTSPRPTRYSRPAMPRRCCR